MTYHDGLGRAFKQEARNVAGTLLNVVTTEYDALGRPFKVSNPHTGTPVYWTETRFDGLGRAVKTIAQDGAQTTYSYSNDETLIIGSAGNQRKHVTDGLARLLKTIEPDPANSNNLTLETSYLYTVRGELRQVTQGAQTRTYNYDAFGRLTSSVTPESGTASYQYNNWHQPTQRTDARGVITTYGYDTLNRLTSMSYNVSGATGVPATPAVTYAYGADPAQNNKGRLLTMTDGAGPETYSYDLLGQVTNVSRVIDGRAYAVAYEYNFAGQIKKLDHPSPRFTETLFDAFGRVSAIKHDTWTYAHTFTYNTAGQLTGFRYGNGNRATYGFSPDRLQLSTLTYDRPSAGTYFAQSYGYIVPGQANDGRIKLLDNLLDNSRDMRFTYDALGRLKTAEAGPDGAEAWISSLSYDRYGNRTQQASSVTGLSHTLSVSATTNRITSAGFVYDANGNLTAEPGFSYGYDAENRLVSVNGGAVTYAYDGNHRRVKKVQGATVRHYIYSGATLIAEYLSTDPLWGPQREYVFNGSQLLASLNNLTLKYQHPDHLSTRLTTNNDGTEAGQRGFYPFGEVWYSTGVSDRRFTSYDYDAETGNDYAIMRQYGNRWGRFQQADRLVGSAGDPQSLNRFGYVANDPVNFIDPLGLEMCSAEFSYSDCGGDAGFWGGGGFGDSVAIYNREFGGLPPEVVAGLIRHHTGRQTTVMLGTVYYWDLAEPRLSCSRSTGDTPCIPAGGTYGWVQVATPPLRKPDFISININVGLPWLANLAGPTVAINVGKNGHVYVGPGINAGKGLTAVSVSATANWMTQPAQLQSFLTKNSFSFSAGYWAGVQGTWIPGSGFAGGGGFVSPQIGGAWTYSFDFGKWFGGW